MEYLTERTPLYNTQYLDLLAEVKIGRGSPECLTESEPLNTTSRV